MSLAPFTLRAALPAALALCLVPAMTTARNTAPPVAQRIPHPTILHGDTLPDDYHWMRDKSDPKVIAYLEAENAYTDAATAPLKKLEDELYSEMLSRIKQTDLTVPYRRHGFLYYTRTEEGKQYPYYCRRKGNMEAPEEMLLDVNALAEGHPFMAVGLFEVSPDGGLLAYSTDTTGFRQYALHLRDLGTGEDLVDHADRVTSLAWAADGRTFFYVQEDPTTKRSYRLYRHVVGAAGDDLVYEEKDEHFDIAVETTRSGAWIMRTSDSHTTSEVAVLPAKTPDAEWRVIAPRVHDRKYFVDHRGDQFWIRVNDQGKNFRLVTAPVATPDPDHWTTVLPHREDLMISQVDCFAKDVVVFERENGLPQIIVLDPATGATRPVPFSEAAYSVGPSHNEEFDTPTFRYAYQSFLTPPSIYDLDLATLESELLKRTEVPGGWDPTHYAVERVWVTARDGVRVPYLLLFHKGTRRDGSAPCLLYGYGSYGLTMNATFNPNRFSLLDRGMVFALAQIRGGGALGEVWHEAGRMANKMNTFTDFIAVAEDLIARNVTRSDRLVIQGGSAGGLLVCGVANMRPDLFKGVLAQVPFVDVINTMLDESLPLTIPEFEEWGNPKVEAQYRWMRAYSPYDNLHAAAYPSMLVRTSLNDSQVMYWEPAKYVARLRRLDTGPNPVLFRCNMDAGHGGKSGRYDALHDYAFDYAWVLNTVGLAGTAPRP